jgi:hypothetical protein
VEALGHGARRRLQGIDRLGIRIRVDEVADAVAQDVVGLLEEDQRQHDADGGIHIGAGVDLPDAAERDADHERRTDAERQPALRDPELAFGPGE